MTETLDLPIAEVARRVAAGEVSAVSLTEQAFTRIERAEKLQAFLNLAKDQALETARKIDERRARGEKLGKLAGVPIAIKDALCTVDAPTTCASKILTRRGSDGKPSTPQTGWRPPFDATVVAKLRAADAVLVGKTNMDEFAMGSS